MEICVYTRTYIYTHRERHVYINIYICLYYECAHACISLLWKPRVTRNNNIPITTSKMHVNKTLVSNTIFKKSGFLEKWLILSLEQGLYKTRLENLLGPERKCFVYLFACFFNAPQIPQWWVCHMDMGSNERLPVAKAGMIWTTE